jgi:hypothetical protein
MRVLLLIAISAIGVAQALQQAASNARVEGTVVDAATGAVLSGVTVSYRAAGQPSTAALNANKILAGRDGRFVVDDLASGRPSIGYGKEGYLFKRLQYVLSPGQQLKDTVVRLIPMGIITGRVLRENGSPVVQGRVTPMQYRYSSAGREMVTRAPVTTDDRGEFRIADLPPGPYFLNITAPGTSRLGPYERTASPPTAGAVLYPGVTRLSSAVPLEVQAGKETRANNVILTSARYDSLQFRLRAEPGSGIRQAGFSIANNTPIVVNPAADGTSPGVSRGAAAPPKVELTPPELVQIFWPDIPGLYRATLRWTAADGTEQSQTVPTQFTGDTQDLELVAGGQKGLLKGTVKLEQADGSLRDLGNVRLTLWGTHDSTTVTTAADGSFTAASLGAYRYDLAGVTGLPTDSFVATARQDHRDVLTEGLNVSSDSSPLDLRIRSGTGRLQGIVTDRDSRPVHDALVFLVPQGSLANVKLASAYASARTDQDGFFSVRGIRPGSYRAYAWAAVDGAPYWNPEFVKPFEAQSKIIQIDGGSQNTAGTLKAIE